MKYNYVFAWANNPKRAEWKGLMCRMICRGKKNSVLIEFEDGRRECVSAYSIRRIKGRSNEERK